MNTMIIFIVVDLFMYLFIYLLFYGGSTIIIQGRSPISSPLKTNHFQNKTQALTLTAWSLYNPSPL